MGNRSELLDMCLLEVWSIIQVAGAVSLDRANGVLEAVYPLETIDELIELLVARGYFKPYELEVATTKDLNGKEVEICQRTNVPN